MYDSRCHLPRWLLYVVAHVFVAAQDFLLSSPVLGATEVGPINLINFSSLESDVRRIFAPSKLSSGMRETSEAVVAVADHNTTNRVAEKGRSVWTNVFVTAVSKEADLQMVTLSGRMENESVASHRSSRAAYLLARKKRYIRFVPMYLSTPPWTTEDHRIHASTAIQKTTTSTTSLFRNIANGTRASVCSESSPAAPSAKSTAASVFRSDVTVGWQIKMSSKLDKDGNSLEPTSPTSATRVIFPEKSFSVWNVSYAPVTLVKTDAMTTSLSSLTNASVDSASLPSANETDGSTDGSVIQVSISVGGVIAIVTSCVLLLVATVRTVIMCNDKPENDEEELVV